MRFLQKEIATIKLFTALVKHARENEDGFVSLPTICDDNNFSIRYMWTIIRPFVERGFIMARHGKTGGFRLKMHWKNITLYNILKVCNGLIEDDEEEVNDELPDALMKFSDVVVTYLKETKLKNL